MQTFVVLGITLLCVSQYFTVAEAGCGTLSRGKMDVCVATFSTANLGNRDQRKALITAKNMTCPIEILKSSCTSFNVLMGCVNTFGFPEGCKMEFNTELKNQDFQCTYLELGVICPDAKKLQTSAAGATVVSLSIFIAAFVATLI